MESSTQVQFKSVLVVVISVVNFYISCFNALILIFAFLTCLDYATGTISAKIRGVWNKQKAKQGAWEKFGFFILIILAMTLDFVTTYLTQFLHKDFSTKGTFTIATCVWLIGTEGISIGDNLRETKVKMPKFLRNGFKRLQDQSEDIASSVDNRKNRKER